MQEVPRPLASRFESGKRNRHPVTPRGEWRFPKNAWPGGGNSGERGEEPGAHTVQWNAANFASGVYVHRLEAGIFSDVKKMILLR